MNEIKVFENNSFGNIRVIERDGEPWFIASDVCKALDIANTTQAISRLDNDERSMFNIGRAGDTNCVNEYGLYSLVLGSRKPEAKEFKRWITHEVIPSIRKNGGYIADQEQLSPEEVVARALLVAQNIIDEKQKVIEAQKEQIGLMAPKADYFDALVDKNLLTNFRDAAKEIGCGQKELVDFCIGAGYVYRDGNGKLKPYSKYTGTNGYFALKDFTNGSYAGVQTYFTPKGKETMRLLIQGRLI